MIETLESRQLFSAGIVDTSYGTAGVTTLRYKTSSSDASIASVSIVNDSTGHTYAMARTDHTLQIRRLNAAGQADSTWTVRNGLLLFPTVLNSTAKIAVDAADRLLVQIGQTLYRFDIGGKLDSSFGNKGRVTFGDFSAKIDFDVDASNRIYVTGSTKSGAGMLVERLISRGKIDRTFDGDGKYLAPLPPSLLKLKTPHGQGEFVRVLDDGHVMIAGTISATGFGTGSEAVRLKADGTLDTSYAHTGVASVLGPRVNEALIAHVTPVSILPNGSVSLLSFSESNPGLGGSPTVESQVFGRTGVLATAVTGTIDRSSAEPDGGYLGVSSAELQRYAADDTLVSSFNHGRPLVGVNDALLLDDSSVLIASRASRFQGRVSIARLLSSIDSNNA